MPEGRRGLVLVVEDDDDDYILIQEAFKEIKAPLEFVRAADGESCGELLWGASRASHKNLKPDLILLDLNLPKKDGRELLREIKARDDVKQIPVVIVSTSKADEDIHFAYSQGASSYISKPSSFSHLKEIAAEICRYWFHTVTLPFSL